MYFHWFYGIFVQIFCHSLLSASLPLIHPTNSVNVATKETIEMHLPEQCQQTFGENRDLQQQNDVIIIQIHKKSVIGAQHVSEQVLLNGVPLTSSRQEVKDLIKSMSADTILPPSIDIDQISALRGHTILRSRECILEGGQLHWADRMFYDDEEYLTLDHNDTWAVHVPQALALKALLDQAVQHTRTERIHLQEGCSQLMKELQLSEERSVPGVPLPQILIPILGVVAFIFLIIVSILLSLKEGSLLAGGVLGSIIHYPRDMTDMTVDKNQRGYRTL